MSSLKLEIQSLKSQVCNQGSEVNGPKSQRAAVSLGRLEPDLKALVEKVFGVKTNEPH